MQTDLQGVSVVVSRTGWSGEVGYEIFLRDGRYGDRLWETVLAAGEPFGIVVTGPSDINRVEAGILAYRSDMDLGTNPYEVGLGHLVDLDTPDDFIGKSALTRIRDEGVSRTLVGVEILGDPLPEPYEARWPVTADEATIGDVTVAVYSPRLGKNIGYAIVGVAHPRRLEARLDVRAPPGGTRRLWWPRSRSSSPQSDARLDLHASTPRFSPCDTRRVRVGTVSTQPSSVHSGRGEPTSFERGLRVLLAVSDRGR